MEVHLNTACPSSSQRMILQLSTRLRQLFRRLTKKVESKLKGNGKTVPALSVLKTPLRDGDLERPDDAAYQMHIS